MSAKLTDDQFITAWKQSRGSPAAVEKITGLSARGIYRRRNSLEARLGIRLETTDGPGGRPKARVEKIGFRITEDVMGGTVMIGSDGHFWPGERSVAFDAFVKLTAKLQPKIVVMNGDSFDGSRISRHPPGGWANLPDVADELAAVQERHGEIEAIAPEKCKLIWTAGNHDSRFTANLAQSAPDYVRVKGMDIADHFPAWNFAWSLWINDNTVIKHRTANGVHAAYNNTLKGGKNIVTGHTHRLHATQWADYNGLRWGIECGTLSEITPTSDKFAYAEDNAFNWSQGFVVLTFDGNGTLLEPEFCRVLNGRAYFRGEPIT